MKKNALIGTLISGVFLIGGLSFAQEAAGPNEKAKRYHTLLLKRPGNPTVFSRFVDAWLDTGDKKEMKAWLEESAKSGGGPEWRVLAAFHEYLGEDEAALDAFHQAVTKNDQDAALRLDRAKLHAKLLSFEAALEDLKVATKDEKLGVEASKLTGIYLARAGRIDEAVKAWKEVIERFPKDEELREDLIEVEVAEGLYDDAIAASQALVGMTKDPYKKALRQLRLGDIQILGNKREDGLATYETIMAATGAGTWLEREVLAQVERVFMREDDIQGLRDFFQKLRETHPRRVSVRKALARQMALNGEMDEAVALFREVLKITPGDVGNREEFIAFLETNERWKEAREELAELLKLRENDPLLWERMAQIEEKQKNPDGVKEALGKVRDLKKGTPEGLIAVAALYSQADLLEESEALLRDGWETFGESDEVTEALASFLIQNEKEKEALEIWTEMAKSADREGLLRVARSLTGHGKSGEAFKLLQGRMDEFGKDALILGQFCALAFSDEEAVIAVPYGLEMVRQSATPTDLEGAIKVAGRVIKKAGTGDEILKQLEEKTDATISERCLITDLYLEEGDTMKALEVLTAAEKDDEGLLARFYRVRYEESRGELEKAIVALRAIIELPEGRKTVHVRRLVGLLESSDNLQGALKAVDDWKRMAPGDQAAWTRRAELLSNNGEPDKAVLELRRMIGKFGAEEDSRAQLAAALLEANEHRSAERIYKQLYEEGDDLAVKLKWVGELAKVAKKEGTLDELLEDFERRKRENANSVAPLLAIAEIHHSLNQYEERRSALLEASRRRPNDIKLLQNIAEVEVRAGEIDRAVGLLKDAAKRDTTSGTKQKLADLYLKNGEFGEGLRLLNEIPDQANDPRKLESTALSLLAMSEWDLTVKHLAEALSKHPEDWRLKYLYAIATEMDGGEEEAFELYRKLLEADGEIKGLKVLYDPKVYRNGHYLKQENLPSAMKGWTKLGVMSRFVSNDARALNQLRDGYRRSIYGRALVSLPGSAEEVRMLSFLRATLLVKSFDKGKQDELLKSLTIDGVEQLELYRMSRGDRAKYFAKIDELLKAEPENPKYLKLWISYRRSAGEDYKSDPESLNRLIETAAKLDAQTMISLISGMLERKEIKHAEVATLMEKLYENTPVGDERGAVLQSLAYFVIRNLNQPESESFHPLARKLIEEAKGVEKKPKTWGWVDQALLISMNLGDGDSAVKLLNMTSAWLLENKGSGASLVNVRNHYSSFGRYGSGGTTLIVPSFPPATVKGLGRSVASLVAKEFEVGKVAVSEVNQRRAELLAQLKPKSEKKDGPAEKKPEPLEAFQGRVDQIEIPVLQALIGAALGDEEAFPKFVDLVAESNDLEELDLAAGYLWKEKKYQESYQLLCRMRMLTLSRIERKAVDGKLAKVGSILADQEKKAKEGEDEKIEWAKEPAQRAALRLRKALTNTGDRQALVNVLVKLGLQKEAEKVGKKPSGGLSSRASSRSTVRAGLPKVMQLMGDGRKEEASREAAKLIKSYQKSSNSQYELKRLSESLLKLDLVDATLEKIDPGESESISRRLAYANLALGVGKKELAGPVFESLIKDRPDMVEAKVGFFICQPDSERKVLNFLGEDQSKIDFENLLVSMSGLWQRADDRFDQTLVMMEITHDFLKALKPDSDEKRNLTWVPYHVLSASSDDYFDGIRKGALFRSRKNQTMDKAKTALFDEVAKKVFEAMLKHPQTAEQGFMMLLKARESLKLKDEDIEAYAQEAVGEVMRRKRFSNRNRYSGYSRRQSLWSMMRANGSSNSSNSLTDVESPLDYLISAGSDRAELFDKLLPILKENQEEKFKTITLARKIVNAEAEEGVKLFQEWQAKPKEGEEASKENPQKSSVELVDFASYALLFELKPSALSEVLEKELISIKNTQYNDSSGWTHLSVRWLRWIARNKDREALDKFIVEVCEEALGPQKQWPILAELGQDHFPDPYRRTSYALASKLNSFCVFDEALFPMMKLAAENNLEKIVPNFSVQNATYQAMQGLQDAKSLLAWIKKSGMFVNSSEGPSAAVNIIGLLGIIDGFPHNGGDHTKEVIKAIKEMELDPLVKQLILMRYEGSSDRRKSLVAAWEERTELLRAMIEKNEGVVMNRMKSWFPNLEVSDEAPNLKELLAGLEKKKREDAMEKAEKWLADGIEIDPNDYQGRKLWAEVTKVAEVDADLASKIALKAIEAADENVGLNRYNSGASRSGSAFWARTFFEALVEKRNSVSLIDKTRIIDRLYRGELGKKFVDLQSGGGNLSYYLRQSVSDGISAFNPPKESKRKAVELAFLEWAKTLSDQEESTFVSIVVPTLLQNWSFSSKDVEGVTRWADKELRKESELMAEALIVIMQKGGASRGSSKKREPMEKKAREAMLKLLPRLELPAPLALGFAFATVNSGDGQALFAGPVQWTWLSGVLGDYANGVRKIETSQALGILPYLVRLEFPEKVESSKKLIATISEKLITPEVLLNSRNNSNSWVKSLLPLALEAGEFDLAKRLIQQNTTSFRGDLAVMLDVASSVDAKTAAKLAQATSLPYKTGNLPNYTKETEEAAQRVLEVLPKRDRYRFEVLVAGLNDTADKEKVAEILRPARLQKIATRFEKEAPSDNGPRWQLLNLLGSDLETRKSLNASFKKEATLMSLSTALALKDEGGSGSTNGGALVEVIKTWLKDEVEAGRPEVMLKELEQLTKKAQGNNTYSIRYLGKEMTTLLSTALLSEALNAPEKAPAIAAQSRKNLDYRIVFDQGARDTDLKGLIWADLFIHLLAGETKAWYERVEKLSEEERSVFEGPLGKEDRWGLQQVVQAKFLQGDAGSESRVSLLTKALGDPVFVEKVMTYYTRLSLFMDVGLIRKDELFEVIDALPKDHSRKAEFLMEKAGIIGWREEGKVKEAEKLYEEARALALEQKNDQIVHLSDALHARLLGQKNRISESWKFGERVDVTHLPEPDKKWFATDSEKWKEAALQKAVESKQDAEPKAPVEK